MEPFEVNILGCGSALPTTRHNSSSQVINVRGKLFMIDCGDGTQLQLRKSHLHFTRLGHIFISHLHGDHCFGLIGLISTFGLLGRTATLHIYAHPDLQRLTQPQLDYYCRGIEFKVEFHNINPTQESIIYEDRSLTIETIPLNHRMPCCGFLFREKQGKRHIKSDMIEYYEIPTYEINRIKNGADYTMPDGEIIRNELITTPPNPARSYAYCSDTAYCPDITRQIEGVNLLFHESTFAQSDAARAADTHHSTAAQAASIAAAAHVKQLIIGHYSSRYNDESILLNEAKAIFPNTKLSNENQVISIL